MESSLIKYTDTLKQFVIQVATKLRQQHLQLVTAESCTGGGLSYWLTSVPESSHWFERGFVTYSEQSKTDLLSVSPQLLKQFGAVSEEVACAMAKGALQHSAAHLSIAITGIAGPGGGSAQKPVGLVWLAFAKGNDITTTHHIFAGDRQAIRLQTMIKALEMILHKV